MADSPDTDTARAAHRRAWDSIPWVVAGSAGADERAALERHLHDCEACREEWAFHQRLHGAMQQRPGPLPHTEEGLAQVMARIDAWPLPAAAGHAVRPPRAWSPVRWLAAAVVVQAVGLGAAGLALWDRTPAEAAYRTWSDAGAAAAPPASVRLVPAATLDAGELQRLLATHRLRIVEAAPDGGSFGLVPVDGQAATVAAALAALRAHPGVRLAEPTGHAPGAPHGPR